MSKFIGLMTGGGPVAREDVDLIVEKLLLQQEVIIHGWRREIERADDLETALRASEQAHALVGNELAALKAKLASERRLISDALARELDQARGVFRPEPEEAAS